MDRSLDSDFGGGYPLERGLRGGFFDYDISLLNSSSSLAVAAPGFEFDGIGLRLTSVTVAEALAANACPVNEKSLLTIAVSRLHRERETGFEPATSSLGSHRLSRNSRTGNKLRLSKTSDFAAKRNHILSHFLSTRIQSDPRPLRANAQHLTG